jgi:hypothetical protein
MPKVTFRGKPLIPSKYLESADLMGKRVAVIIESVHERVKLQTERGDDDNKPLFRLRGKEKGWVLNTTNLDSIAEVYGYDAEKWVGKTVVVYAAKVKAFGETWQAIRVDVDETQKRANAKPAPRPAAQAAPPHDPETGEVTEPSAEEAARELDDATSSTDAVGTWDEQAQ